MVKVGFDTKDAEKAIDRLIAKVERLPKNRAALAQLGSVPQEQIDAAVDKAVSAALQQLISTARSG